ncbi:MAG: Serine protease Do-like HtrA [Firmicutes bacterium]|nr:Serine protease Do-like HtrA [candidate division NPL-UPA2 bacterium]
MSEYYEFQSPRYSRRRPSVVALVVVSVLAALFGAVMGAYIGPTFLYGKLIPYPPSALSPNLTQPRLTGANPLTEQIAAGAVAQVAQRVSPTVVGVVNRSRVQGFFGMQQQQSTGSGIIFDPAGLIVTNQHVVSRAAEISVILFDNLQVPAQLVGEDERTDLAVLKIDVASLPATHRPLPVAEFGDSEKLVVGELAIAIGNPLGIEFQGTVTAGIISAVERTLTMDDVTFRVIQTDAAINSGNSGGALANSRGQIIGINQAKIAAGGVEGMGFAIPINVARPIIRELIEHGRVIRPWMGIRGTTVTPSLAAQYGLTVNAGIFIEVVPNSPAARAGLRLGDVIVRYNGTEITDFEQMRELITATGIGGTAELVVRRGTTTLTVRVRLEPAP